MRPTRLASVAEFPDIRETSTWSSQVLNPDCGDPVEANR